MIAIPARQAARWMAVSWLVWTVIALIDVIPAIALQDAGRGGGVYLRRYLFAHATIWYSWWLLSPLVYAP